MLNPEPNASDSLDVAELLMALILVGADIGSTSSTFLSGMAYNWRPGNPQKVRN